MAIEKLNFTGAGQSSNSSSSNNVSGYSSIADRFLDFGDQLNKDQIIRERDAYAKERDLIADKRYEEQQAILKAERDKKANTEKSLLDFQNQMSNYETSGIVDANKGIALSNEYDNLKASGKSDAEASNIIQNRINSIEQQDKKMLDESPIARYDRINSLKISGDGIDPTMLITLKNQKLKELMDAEDKKQDRAFDEKKFNQDVAESNRNYNLQMQQFNKNQEDKEKEIASQAIANSIPSSMLKPEGKKIEETTKDFSQETQIKIGSQVNDLVEKDSKIKNSVDNIENIQKYINEDYNVVNADNDFSDIEKNRSIITKNIESKIKSIENKISNNNATERDNDNLNMLKFELQKANSRNPKELIEISNRQNNFAKSKLDLYSKTINERLSAYEQEQSKGFEKDKVVGTGKYKYQYTTPEEYATEKYNEARTQAIKSGKFTQSEIDLISNKAYNSAYKTQLDAIKSEQSKKSDLSDKEYERLTKENKTKLDALKSNFDIASEKVKTLEKSGEASSDEIEKANQEMENARNSYQQMVNSILK